MDPIRVASQLIDAALVEEGVQYLQRYARLVEESPRDAGVEDPGELLYVVAVLLQDRGEIEPAIAAYRRALEYQPEDVRILKDLAALLAKLGQIEPAAEVMAKAVQLAPDDVDGVRKLGMLRVAQRRLPEAIAAFEKVVVEQPGDVAVLYNLANALRSMGTWDEAIVRYEQVVERNPSMVLAANNLAWIRATHPDSTLRDGSVAVELATSVCEQTQHREPSFLDTLAAAYAEAGDFARAVEIIDQAVLLLQEAGAPDATTQALKDRGQLYSDQKPYRDSSMSVDASR
jgi:tetratricopeptide (TPR) repeat protein